MSIPYFDKPLFFFAQARFRRDLETKPNNITIFKNAISGTNTQFDMRYREGEDVRSLVYERAIFIDCILHYAWHQFTWDQNIALIAVGGYGRGELHPRSDIDLLILLKDENTDHYNGQLEAFITFLWDIGLDIGHSVRSIKQCIDIAKQDITVATNIMDSRTVVGNPNLCRELLNSTTPNKIWPIQEFFNAKWNEQKARHNKHNNTELNLEPNIKNAPGGLRDIQTIDWVAKRYFGVRTLRQLGGQDFFTEEEFALLQNGEEFLWKVRYGLHMIAGRAEERLLFDHQRSLAKLFGYVDNDLNLAVEQFMHNYYRIVISLRELNDVLLNFLDESINGSPIPSAPKPINDRFQLRDNYIEVTHDNIFEENPSALIEIFVLMGNDHTIQGVRPSTIRLIRENRYLIDDSFREDPKNCALFLDLMCCQYALTTQLLRMKRYNILGRYLPEFGRIIGQMQHDLFHIYTVDAHTLSVVHNMRKLRHRDYEEKFPIAAHCFRRLPKPELLYIAGLYHDIAKGRGGDHSTLGAVDAHDFCIRHGLNPREARLVAWLVEKHLLMSTVSQKQDISDPDVIHWFASEMGDQMHLNYLLALTVADINATNPNLWTTWRASLMRQLYMETKRALRRGLENTIDKQDLIEETKQTALRRLDDKGISEQTALTLWKNMGEDYFLRETAADITWHCEEIVAHNSESDMVMIRETTAHDYEGATQIFIRTRNQKNVFATVVSGLDHLNLNIQDARIYNTEVGAYTIDTFFVLDENNLPIGDNPQRIEQIRKTLLEDLELVDDPINPVTRRTPRQLKYFATPTRARISTDINSISTVLEVISPDRPGLLARIAQIFIDFGIELQNAKITTLGERVEDIFFITDSQGFPLSDPALCDKLQREICRQLDKQVQVDANSF